MKSTLMHSFRNASLLSLIILSLVLFAGQTLADGDGISATGVTATGVASIEIPSISISGCSGSTIVGSVQVRALDAQGNILNQTTPETFDLYFNSDGGAAKITFALNANPTNFQVGFGAPITYGLLTVALASDPAITSSTYIMDCATLDTTIIILNGVKTDGRVNYYMGDLVAVLYARADTQGRPVLHVYDVQDAGENADAKGVFIGLYSYDDFAPYLDEAPAQNVEIGSVGLTTLYALTSGEFQVNIGPDSEGKITSVIFTGLPPRGVYSRVLVP